jgi:phage shock protein C
MYCTRCGTQLNDTAKFCSDCGHATARPNSQSNAYGNAQPPLARPRDNRKIAGVCAGLARYLGVDVTLVRLITLILLFVPPFPAVIAYIVAWIVMPNDPLPSAAYQQTATQA